MKRIFKKVMKVILTIVIVIAVILCLLTIVSRYKEAHYYNNSEAAGEIEKKYTALGQYKVSHQTVKVDDDQTKSYEIYYPSDLETASETYPLVIMVNGTGVPVSKYGEVLKHLASWGFIVAGNEDEQSRSGESSASTLDYMISQNQDSTSIFYSHIDTDHIGIAGHSQGGVGAINAVTNQSNSSLYKAIWTASATSTFWSQDGALGSTWSYNVTKITIPYMMVAGTGTWDAGTATDITATEGQGICPLWSLTQNYDQIPSNVPKVMGRLTGKDHGDMLRYADGYMTAWFMFWLKDDNQANAFFGENPEILTNSRWQDVRTNNGNQ